MSKIHKVRASNFTNSEIGHLLRIIVNKYAAILEDKRNDRVSSERKNKAWKDIEKEYNASSTSTTYRSAFSLRKCFENRKTLFRRLLAEEQKERLLTDGPRQKWKRDQNDEVLLSMLNNKTRTENGRHKPVKVQHSTSNSTDSSIKNSNIVDSNQTQPNLELDGDTCKTCPTKLQGPISASPVVSDQLEPNSIENTSDSEGNKAGYTPRDTNHRTPTGIIKTLASSDIAKKNYLLLDKKLSLLDKQLESMDHEKEFLARKRQLEIEILETELALKRQQLADTLPPSCNNK